MQRYGSGYEGKTQAGNFGFYDKTKRIIII